MTSYWLTDDSAPTTSVELPERAGVVVVGAGITGMVTALLLARAGREVLVLEARRLGAVTTGHTTGKVSLLQGTKLSELLRHQSEKAVSAYVEANREGQAWLLRLCDDAGIDAPRRTAVTYAAQEGQRSSIEDEHAAASRLGLPTRLVERLDAPFPTYGAVSLSDQAQIDPMPVLEELARQLSEHGGRLVEGVRVVSAAKSGRPTVRTDTGHTVDCDELVLATGTPILDRGLYFAKVKPLRSYVTVYAGAQPPADMMISAGPPVRSLREVGDGLLMVGGEGHPVGRARSEEEHLDRLRAWTHEHYPGARETHAWSSQDYRSHDGFPSIGALPRGGGAIYFATGYDKWGLTNGVAAGLRIAGELLGQAPSWSKPIKHRITRPRGAARLAAYNAEVGAYLALGLAGAELRSAPDEAPADEGRVGRAGLGVPVATSTVDGEECRLLALCTHLGGVVKWNDAEQTWDCPLHGSRFAADGSVLEGPATRPLKRLGTRRAGTGR